MRKIIRSLSVRISLIFSTFTITILVIMGLVISHLVTQHYYEMDNQVLLRRIAGIETLLLQNPNNDPHTIHHLETYYAGPRRTILRVERPIGTVLYSTDGVSFPTQVYFDQSRMRALQEWQDHTMHYHIAWLARQSEQQQPSYRIVMGTERNFHARFLNKFYEFLWSVGGIGTISLMLLGWFAAWRGLRPVQSMAYLAERISAHRLTERLNIEKTPTELTRLAVAFNEMLDRLKFTFTRLSDFSSDLAHELRAPINNIMTQTQVCLSKPRDNQTYQEVLYSNLEELERLSHMISDMLLLAEADHGTHVLYSNSINLGHEIRALCEYYEVLADEKGMKLVYAGEAEMVGDQLMLRRALGNLILNAIRYGIEQTSILIEIMQQDDSIIITIKNQTQPISPEQLERFFDRFYRVDRSRLKVDGTGLGLAITKSIIEMHGGEIEVYADSRSITFTMFF